jgi:hypothetical protein
MKQCLICGRASQPGAKLCSDCSSARKRAFAATVTQPLLAATGRSGGRLLRPSQSMAATARRAAERALAATPAPAVAVAPPSRRMEVIFFVATLVAVVLIGAYIARQIQKSRQPDAAQVVEQPPVMGPGAISNTASVVPPGLSPKNVAETPPPMTGAMPVDESTPVPARKAEPSRRANAKPRGPAVEVTPPVEPAAAPAPVAVAPAPAPPPQVREVPKTDPLQQLNESLSRCAAGGLFDRILCDQRVRREYCDGRWGQVPQCPSGVPNDRGQ